MTEDGYAGEQIFNQQLKASRLQKIELNLTELIKIAQSLNVGKDRLIQAMPYLLSEYGRQVGRQFLINWQ